MSSGPEHLLDEFDEGSMMNIPNLNHIKEWAIFIIMHWIMLFVHTIVNCIITRISTRIINFAYFAQVLWDWRGAFDGRRAWWYKSMPHILYRDEFALTFNEHSYEWDLSCAREDNKSKSSFVPFKGCSKSLTDVSKDWNKSSFLFQYF